MRGLGSHRLTLGPTDDPGERPIAPRWWRRPDCPASITGGNRHDQEALQRVRRGPGFPAFTSTAAAAGEVTGSGKPSAIPRSVCAFSGLNDHVSPEEPDRTQSFGTLVRGFAKAGLVSGEATTGIGGRSGTHGVGVPRVRATRRPGSRSSKPRSRPGWPSVYAALDRLRMKRDGPRRLLRPCQGWGRRVRSFRPRHVGGVPLPTSFSLLSGNPEPGVRPTGPEPRARARDHGNVAAGPG